VENYHRSVAGEFPRAGLSPGVVRVLGLLGHCAELRALEEVAAPLLESGYLTGEQSAALREASRRALVALRPEAVTLVDAFAFEDYYLNSALGRADGDVYRALYDMAQGSPLNRTEEGPAWEHVIKPGMAKPSALLGAGTRGLSKL
jgi:acyl-CoA oxidase